MADKAILYDATKCTACRGCQVACKQWNENDEYIPPPSDPNGVMAHNWGSYENPPDLSPIVAIDGARRIEHGHAVLDRQAATRAHLGLKTLRQRNRDAAWHKVPAPGSQSHRLSHRRQQVHPDRPGTHVPRQRKIFAVGPPPHRHFNLARITPLLHVIAHRLP